MYYAFVVCLKNVKYRITELEPKMCNPWDLKAFRLVLSCMLNLFILIFNSLFNGWQLYLTFRTFSVQFN